MRGARPNIAVGNICSKLFGTWRRHGNGESRKAARRPGGRAGRAWPGWQLAALATSRHNGLRNVRYFSSQQIQFSLGAQMRSGLSPALTSAEVVSRFNRVRPTSTLQNAFTPSPSRPVVCCQFPFYRLYPPRCGALPQAAPSLRSPPTSPSPSEVLAWRSQGVTPRTATPLLSSP